MITESIPASSGTMNLLPMPGGTNRIQMNVSSVSSLCRRAFIVGMVALVFVFAFFTVQHYHHRNGEHQRRGHHSGKFQRPGDKNDKIKRAIDENIEALKSRAGNLYIDNEYEVLKRHNNRPYDDDHEDDYYEDDAYADDEDYDDDDDSDEDYDENKDKKHSTSSQP